MVGRDVTLGRFKTNILYAKSHGQIDRAAQLKIERAEYKKIKKENRLSSKAKINEQKPKKFKRDPKELTKLNVRENAPDNTNENAHEDQRTEDPAVAMHRIRQHEFSIIARKTTDYSDQLIVPCTCCSSPRACIFNSWIFYNDELKRWEAYCAACTACVSVDRTLLKATYDILRVGTWFAQFGVQAKGECCACATQLDFWNFHRAHDIASSLLPDGTVDSIRNSFISCQTCNLGTGTIPFSNVIVDTRAHLKLEPLRERSDSSMIEQGIAWMNNRNPTGICPWDTVVLPLHLRYKQCV